MIFSLEITVARAGLQEGDIVFQSLPAEIDLVRAIEGCSDSPYSHCGIIVKNEGGLMVLESLGEVKYTKLTTWLRRGRNQKMAVYRFKEAQRQHIPQLISSCKELLGLPYDSRYRLEKDEIYCSELIFHSWRQVTQNDLGQVRQLGELNWKPYIKTIQKYEKSKEIPLERWMITPVDLSRAKELEKVFDNGVHP